MLGIISIWIQFHYIVSTFNTLGLGQKGDLLKTRFEFTFATQKAKAFLIFYKCRFQTKGIRTSLHVMFQKLTNYSIFIGLFIALYTLISSTQINCGLAGPGSLCNHKDNQHFLDSIAILITICI